MLLAFTLLETIVACTVAAILAALVSAVLLKGVFAAKSQSCLSNLQTISHSLELYRSDADGMFPPYALQDFSAMKERQVDFKRSLGLYGATDDKFYYPLDSHKRTQFLGEFYSFQNTSYWMPLEVYFAAAAGADEAMVFNPSTVAKPAEMPILADQSWIVEQEGGQRIRQTAHKDRLNVLHLDGHVKSLPVSPP